MRSREYAIVSTAYLMVVVGLNSMVFFSKRYSGEENIYMGTTIETIATVTTLVGMATVFVSQILFYKKEAQAMSELRQLLTSGNERLSDRLESNEKELSGEHEDIRDVVKEIQLKQEQELELQKAIRDTVPDAGMIKSGIDKICEENAKLRSEILDLKREVEQLQEKNKDLAKSNKKLHKELENYIEHDDRER